MNRLRYLCLEAGLWGTLLGLCAIARAAGPDAELVRFESTQPQMGVPVKIILYAADERAAKGAFAAAFSRFAELDHALSDYDPHSELSRLSRTAGSDRAVPLGEDLWQVLARSQALAAETGGAFDVTVGPYVRLWRRARRQRQMPDAHRLEAARRAAGHEKLELDPSDHSARLLVSDMRLDLGGIAMGYAVDEALAELRSRGISRVLVDASGDVGLGDPPPGSLGWTIGVAPVSVDGPPRVTIRLANAAVTTSGDAFQHVVIDGRRYSHIVDPHTGLGLTDQSGVTVIARDCTTADSLATAVSVLGPQAGLALVERTCGAAALIVRVDGEEALDEPGPNVSEAAPRTETFESRRFRSFVVADTK